MLSCRRNSEACAEAVCGRASCASVSVVLNILITKYNQGLKSSNMLSFVLCF